MGGGRLSGAGEGVGGSEGDLLLDPQYAMGGPQVLAAAPPEALQQAAAQRMQRLLVLGRRADALKVGVGGC